MSFKTLCLATALTVCFNLPASAGAIMVQDPYARASGKSATSGAAFMMLMNHGAADDRFGGGDVRRGQEGRVAHAFRRCQRCDENAPSGRGRCDPGRRDARVGTWWRSRDVYGTFLPP